MEAALAASQGVAVVGDTVCVRSRISCSLVQPVGESFRSRWSIWAWKFPANIAGPTSFRKIQQSSPRRHLARSTKHCTKPTPFWGGVLPILSSLPPSVRTEPFQRRKGHTPPWGALRRTCRTTRLFLFLGRRPRRQKPGLALRSPSNRVAWRVLSVSVERAPTAESKLTAIAS